MKFILVLLALIVPTGAMAQVHPPAKMLEGFSVEVYSAAQKAEEVAKKADVAYTKALADMKKVEAEFRLAVEKEQDMEKFVIVHSRYMQAAMAVLRSTDGLGEANASVSRIYFKLTDPTADLAREIVFLEWLKAATTHETQLKLSGRVDQKLSQAGMEKMLAFIK